MNIELRSIGTIHSPHQNLEGMPIQPSGAEEVKGWIEIDPAYQEGLQDLEGFSHLILLYYFHQAGEFQPIVVPFLDQVARGLFSTRAPNRPNPLGLSIVRLVRREENRITVTGVDVLDGTPLLDIKPYVPAFDRPEPVQIGWLERSADQASTKRSDQRFR